MKRSLLASLIGLALATSGCGSDSPEPQQKKDAAANKDTPPAGGDVLVFADGKDLPASPPETMPDLPVPADTPAAHDVTKLDVAAVDVGDAPAKDTADAPAGIDSGIDALALDQSSALDGARAVLDTQAVDLTALTSVIGFPCRNDGDCCIAIDNCMNVAYLYSKGPGAAPAPEISPPAGGICTSCIPPSIQVTCVSGQCVGTRISSYPAELRNSHCGYVKLADAGVHVPMKVDAAPPTTKSSWSCGGD